MGDLGGGGWGRERKAQLKNETNSPAARRERYLEPHGLPVGRLDVLEVVRLLLVVLVYLFAEEGYSVPASEYFL